jgi:hypothetical protein
MAKFYGSVGGHRGVATRTGTRNIRTSAQSWDGSVITELSYNSEDKLMVEVRADNYSTSCGLRIFYGTYEEFVNKLKS